MVLPFVLGVTAHSAGTGHEAMRLVAHHHGAHGAGSMTDLSPAAGHPTLHRAHEAAQPSGPNPLVGADTGHGVHAAARLSGLPDGQIAGLLAALLHTVGYLLVMGIVAVIVYERLGLRLLRSMWFNLDLIWAGALIFTGVLGSLL